jgi:hypothetical protein
MSFMEYKGIREFFGCGCFDLNHVVSITFDPEVKSTFDEKYSDEAGMGIYLFSTQYRTNIIPHFWEKYFWLDDFYRKRYWTDDFYHSSFWKKIGIAINYVLGKDKEEFGIFDVPCLMKKDKERLLGVLSSFGEEKVETTAKLIETDGDDYNKYILQIVESKEEDELVHIVFRFRKKKGFKKVLEALKYLFREHSMQHYFEITSKNANILKSIVERR